MKTSILVAVAALAALIIGILVGRQMPGETQAPGSDENEILYWVAPMDPDYRRDEPGKSPMGMDLVPVYANSDDAQSGVVSIDPTLVNNLGIRTALAERGSLPRRIETVGYIGYDEDTLQHVEKRKGDVGAPREDRDGGSGQERGTPVRTLFANACKCAAGIPDRARKQQPGT